MKITFKKRKYPISGTYDRKIFPLSLRRIREFKKMMKGLKKMGDCHKEFGQFVKKKRMENGLTLPQLANEIGITKTCMQKIEEGRQKRMLSVKHVKRMAFELKIPVVAIMEGMGYLSIDDFSESVKYFMDKLHGIANHEQRETF